MTRIFFKLTASMVIAGLTLIAPAFAKDSPGTADLDFLLGSWALEAHQSPGTERETRDNGERVCAYVLDDAYIRCDTQVRRSNGRSRKVVSLHNYNGVVERYESLYYFSNWPVKPLARTEILRDADTIRWVNHFEFEIEQGRTEFIRSEFTFVNDVIENNEYLRTSDDAEGVWRLNYRERLVKQPEAH